MIERPLRALHLFANYKWTGPADPAIRCAVWQRRLGVDLRFAQAAWTLPGAEHRMAMELSRARLPVLAGLELRKHFRFGGTTRDALRLAARLRDDPVDVVHTHLLGDHLVAALAVRGLERQRPILVRSLYDSEAPRRGWRSWLAFGVTDGFVAPTDRVARGMVERFGLSAARVLVQDPPTESSRVRMQGDLRARLGIGDGEMAVGITARIQPHRRFELLWEIVRRAVVARPDVRFVLLGRGNAEDTARLVTEPLKRLGLEGRVALPGYLYEPDYSLALRSLDAFLFLVPGSDGTCRALREAMALGLPIVATPRGMLPDLLSEHPDLVGGGPAGQIRPEDPDAIADALVALRDDPNLRARLGRAAARRVAGPMDPLAASRRLLRFYQSLRDARRSLGG